MSDLPFPDDELVSAYLDGEADADERARVEGDPALMARADELRRVRELVRAPVTEPAAADVDRAVAAALAAATEPNSAAGQPVHSLADRRRPSSLPAWLSVAALVLGLLVAVSVLGSVIGGGDDSDDSETAAVSDSDEEASTLESDDAGGGAVQAPAADDQTTHFRSGPVDLGDLGAVADEAALAEAIGPEVTARRALVEEQGEAASGVGEDGAGSDGDDNTASTTTVPGAVSPSAAGAPPRCERPDLGEPVLRATAVYDGTEAVVFVYETDETRVLVLAVDSCGVIADFTL